MTEEQAFDELEEKIAKEFPPETGWGWDEDHYEYHCKGCSPHPHESFWKTVVESPQWAAWEKDNAASMSWLNANGWDVPEAKQYKERLFDVDECRCCGWMSPRHLQEFLLFVADRYDWGPKEEGDGRR